MDTEILATAPKPGTSLRTATAIKAGQRTASSRPRTSTGRPLTGIARPGTIQQRAGTSSLSGNRTALQTGRVNTARNIRLGSASIFALADNTFNMSRLNPSVFATKPTVAKILFLFLYYHEGDVKKALDLCNAVMELNKTEAGWWWLTQKGLILITFERLAHTKSFYAFFRFSFFVFFLHFSSALWIALGRCLIAVGNARLAESFLQASMKMMAHPDTILLLGEEWQLCNKIDDLSVFSLSPCVLPNRSTARGTWGVRKWAREAAEWHFAVEAARTSPWTDRQSAGVGEDLQANHSTRCDEHRSAELHCRSLLLQPPAWNGADVLPTSVVDGIECVRAVLQHRIVLLVRRSIGFGFLMLSASFTTGD